MRVRGYNVKEGSGDDQMWPEKYKNNNYMDFNLSKKGRVRWKERIDIEKIVIVY